jgi:hypothetical protein
MKWLGYACCFVAGVVMPREAQSIVAVLCAMIGTHLLARYA